MTTPSHIPSWITPKIFENALRESVPDFKEVESFKVYDALGPGENYVAMALKVEINCRLHNSESLTTQSFFLKVSYDNDLYNTMMYKWNVFVKEQEAYNVIIPEFEKLYRDAGVEVHFGAKTYKLPVKYEYLLLEDLSRKLFRNSNRQNGLDMKHSQSVLKKLAQWHAASAVRVERKGPYAEMYKNGAINPEGKALVYSMMNAAIGNILNVCHEMKDSHVYYDKLNKLRNCFPRFLLDHLNFDPNGFNVLNHGDFWCNNIMFQYVDDDDDDHKVIKEIFMVDYQMLRYAAPSQDLIYFILTSVQHDLKVARFDDLIKYYHEHLIENLKLLKYSKVLPSLESIQKSVREEKAYANFAALTIMPAALADPVKSATLDNLVGDSEESTKLKEQVLKQFRIQRDLELLLPWMYYKGYFDYKQK